MKRVLDIIKDILENIVDFVLFLLSEATALFVIAPLAALLIWYLSSLECNWIHKTPVPQEDLDRCAPAIDFGKCLKRLGHHNSKYVCE